MSFPSLPLFSRDTLTPNHKRTSANGKVPNNPMSNLNTRSSTSSYSGPSITTPTTPPAPSSSKPRQKSKAHSRPKAHHINTTDTRSKSKAKAESRPKGSKLRMRVKRDIVVEAPDADTTAIPHTLGSGLGSEPDDEHPDGTRSTTEDDETEGEAETDRDTEAEADTSVEAEATHRTLTVDPFSAEEERIITVLSRKLEQLRESETTDTTPLSPVEASSPPVPLPSSAIAGSMALNTHGQRQAPETLAGVPVTAAKSNDVGADPSRTSQQEKHSQKRIAPPATTSTTVSGTFNRGANNVYPVAGVSSRRYADDRTSSVDSDIYALSPSPAPSSPSSVYAAPVNYRNSSANTSTSARSNSKATSNGHAVPIAVNGSSTSNGHAKSRQDDDIPIELNNTYNRTYGAHISTLSSPEMSLSASPCETYDTRWMGTKVNPNGTGFAKANGNTSKHGNGKARFDGLGSTRVQGYEQESGSQTQTQLMLHALMQENDQLKGRMADMESNYLRLAGLNEAYRVELIGYRTRLGLSVDNLIGLASDPLPESSPSPPRLMSTQTQGPHTYHSPFGNAFNNNNSYNNIHANSNSNNAYQYHHSYSASGTSSPRNSTSVLNPPPSLATARNGHHSYLSSRIECTPNGFGYDNGRNGITEQGFGSGSNPPRNMSAISSTTSTGVPIPRPLSQVHTNRQKELPMMTMPMSLPRTDDSLLYMHGSTSRSVNEPRALATSVHSHSYSSPPYSNDSPALLSPSYASSYSAASSSAASSSAASSASASTNVTSPPSSLSFTMMMMLPPTFGVPSRGLSYPLVPPPSLSSSLGSGSGFWEGAGGTSGNLSPVDPSGPSAVSRRGSNAGMSVGRRGSVSGGVAGSAGVRVMETGSLRRSRRGSLNHGTGYISRPETVDETEGDHEGLAAIREP